MTGVWVTADTITAARMNEKTIFQGTGSDINGLTTYSGMLAFCTSTGSGFVKDVLYQRNTGNTAWSVVGLDHLPYLKLSTTIGDYTAPNAAVATSTSTVSSTTTYDHVSITGTEWALNASGNYIRLGVKIIAGAPAIGTYIKKVKFSLRKVNSPTGNAVVRVRNASDTVLATSGNLDVSTLTTSFADYEFTLDNTVQLISGYRVMIEYGTSSDPNSIRVESKLETVETGYNWTGYVASYSDTTTHNVAMTFDSTPATVTGPDTVTVYDDSTSSMWKSTSESSPAIYVDLSGSNREIVGVALNIDKTTTTVTAIKIRASTSTTFTDAENIAYVNISDFTDDTWRFIPNNFLANNRRYVQVIGVGTGVLAINEIKVRYGVSDLVKILTHKHRTRTVDSADAFVDSN